MQFSKVLNIVCGLPGNGKTTLARKLPGVAIATDDFPGLYIEGIYQAHLQKESHQWCFDTVEKWMIDEKPEITVNNTFVRNMWRKPYIDLAKKYGYTVHLITSEGVILPNGDRTKSDHNVPESIIDSMRQTWEPVNPPQKKGITTAELAAQMMGLEFPDLILFDMDGTIKRPLDGKTFSKSPSDFEITPEFERWAKRFYPDESYIAIISNQYGIKTGNKTIEFLEEEISLLLETELIKNELTLCEAFFAPDKNSKDCLIYAHNQNGKLINVQLNNYAYKPNTGMYEYVLDDLGICISDIHHCWIVGNSHTDEHSEDWQFALNCQKVSPNIDVRYVPIEMLNIYWNLLNH